MNKISLFVGYLAALSFTSLNTSSAQDADFRKFGFGVAYSPFDMTSISGSAAVMPVTGINFVYNVASEFRSELSLGLLNVDFETEKEKINMFSTGVGLFYTKRIEASVLMGGFRMEYLSGRAESKNSMGENIDNEIDRLSYGPACSFEQLFGKHFGLGAEVGVRSANYKEVTLYPGLPEEDYEINAWYMQNTIFIRGYF